MEIRRDGSSALIEDAHAAGALVIGSFHDFEGTPSDDQLAEVLADMNYAGADVLKFACMAHSATDAARVLGAQAWAREAYDRPVIGIAMGPSGAPRAWLDPHSAARPLSRPSGERGQRARPVHHRAGSNGPRHH